MARIKIDKKIVSYRVESADDKAGQKGGLKTGDKASEKQAKADSKRLSVEGNVVRMHEKLERPEMLQGSTYKVKTPVSDHAMYVTINDVILNPGTEHEQRRPFEIFINSKNLDHYQWIVALTR
ncbi:MAG: NrdJb, partial [Gammaproteobacteria bacterium]